MARRTIWAPILLVGWLATVPSAPAAAQDSVAATLRSLIANTRAPWGRWPDFSRYVDDVARLYASRADATVWLDGRDLRPTGRAAVDELLAAGSHGLDPRDYDAYTLNGLARRTEPAPLSAADLARFDLLLTVGVIRYLDDLRWGRLRPASLDRSGAAVRVDWAAVVSRGLQGDSIPRLVAAVVPRLTQYRNLQRLLPRYRRLAQDTTLRPVPAALVRPGEAYPGMAPLRARLLALGDLASDGDGSGAADRYEGQLVDGVRRFQLRHGLAVDGILGPKTIVALNTPFERRVQQLELALERLRWLPQIGAQPFVVVNIPAFRLFAFDSVGGTGTPSLSMKVVVGKALETRTPMLFEQMRYVEFRPYWNVPRSILTTEILPALRRNPGYLRSQDMEMVAARDRVVGDAVTPDILRRLARGELRVRQRPGPSNALGLAKFVFPNAASVYLHGTPNTELFAQTRRDFSHGCIRVENPAALAAWVLRDQPEWPADRVEAALNGSTTLRALLTRPMPVAIFYTTAVAFPDGTARFYPDIYGLDRTLAEALRGAPALP